MCRPGQLRTARLLLRRWSETDHAPFAVLNADPMVMEYFPDRLTRAESDDLVSRIEAGFAARGYGLWALEVRATGEFVGFTGLSVPSFNTHFTPASRLAGAWRGLPGAGATRPRPVWHRSRLDFGTPASRRSCLSRARPTCGHEP